MTSGRAQLKNGMSTSVLDRCRTIDESLALINHHVKVKYESLALIESYTLINHHVKVKYESLALINHHV